MHKMELYVVLFYFPVALFGYLTSKSLDSVLKQVICQPVITDQLDWPWLQLLVIKFSFC